MVGSRAGITAGMRASRFVDRRFLSVDISSLVVFSLGEIRIRAAYKGTMSCSLVSVLVTCHKRVALNVLVESLAYELALEAELPDDEQDVVEQLQANIVDDSRLGYAANTATSTAPRG